jgi:hypothetical protein
MGDHLLASFLEFVAGKWGRTRLVLAVASRRERSLASTVALCYLCIMQQLVNTSNFK